MGNKTENHVLVKVKKTHPAAVLPTYATDGSGCFDLYNGLQYTRCASPGSSSLFGTGLAFEVPAGYAMLIFSRSGHGFNHSVRLANCVGVVDSDYRGEVYVALHNDGHPAFTVHGGDRIAQAMVIPVPKVTFCEVDELSETERGAGGFGSTGA